MRVFSQTIDQSPCAKQSTSYSPRFLQKDSPDTLRRITTSLQLKQDFEMGSAHTLTFSHCINCLTMPITMTRSSLWRLWTCSKPLTQFHTMQSRKPCNTIICPNKMLT